MQFCQPFLCPPMAPTFCSPNSRLLLPSPSPAISALLSSDSKRIMPFRSAILSGPPHLSRPCGFLYNPSPPSHASSRPLLALPFLHSYLVNSKESHHLRVQFCEALLSPPDPADFCTPLPPAHAFSHPLQALTNLQSYFSASKESLHSSS